MGIIMMFRYLKYKIMKRIPSYPSATSAVLLGVVIALFLYGVVCIF